MWLSHFASVLAVLRDRLYHKEDSGFCSWSVCTVLSFFVKRWGASVQWGCTSLTLGKMGRSHLSGLLAPPQDVFSLFSRVSIRKVALSTDSWLLGSAQGSNILPYLVIAAIEKALRERGLEAFQNFNCGTGILTISSQVQPEEMTLETWRLLEINSFNPLVAPWKTPTILARPSLCVSRGQA